jgi:hypothetical protein
MTPFQRERCRMHYRTIRGHYLQHHSEAQWQAACRNPPLFNAAWRQQLQLPAGDSPPPEPFRRLGHHHD